MGRGRSKPIGLERVGDAFVRWLHDPLTPTTAPGNTCMAGVRNFERRRDWQTSGIESSDGCGAVMRVFPLALAFRGKDLLEAARILRARDPRPSQCRGGSNGRGLAPQADPRDGTLG